MNKTSLAQACNTYPAKVLGYLLLAVLLLVGLLALVLSSLLIALLWSDHQTIGNVTWQAMVAVHSAWIAIAASLVALVAFRHRKMGSTGRATFRIAARTFLVFLPAAVGATLLQASQPSHPLNTELDVRPRLETLLKQRVRGGLPPLGGPVQI